MKREQKNEKGGALLLAPFFSRSLTLVLCSLLLNRTETLATQATFPPLVSSRFFFLREFSPALYYPKEKRLPFAGYSSRCSDSRARRSVGSELNCTAGKRGGRERVPSPLSPLVVFFFFVNFSPALYYLNAWNRLLYPIISDQKIIVYAL